MDDRGLDQAEIVQVDEMLEVVVLQLFLQHQTALVMDESL